jgi:hypothetical protein
MSHKSNDEYLEQTLVDYKQAQEDGDETMMKYFLLCLRSSNFHKEADVLVGELPLSMQDRLEPDIAHQCGYDQILT